MISLVNFEAVFMREAERLVDPVRVGALLRDTAKTLRCDDALRLLDRARLTAVHHGMTGGEAADCLDAVAEWFDANTRFEPAERSAEEMG